MFIYKLRAHCRVNVAIFVNSTQLGIKLCPHFNDISYCGIPNIFFLDFLHILCLTATTDKFIYFLFCQLAAKTYDFDRMSFKALGVFNAIHRSTLQNTTEFQWYVVCYCSTELYLLWNKNVKY
uniref:Uncharacterized protein n=1 Tax=Bactrocera latifrons TaxID=174628 RepID=A0A0K8UKZ9_BACLA